MESMRVFQRSAALPRQLFFSQARCRLPATHHHRAMYHQTRAPLQQSFRTRPPSLQPPQRALLRRSIQTQRPAGNFSSQAFRTQGGRQQALRRRNNVTSGSGRRYNSSNTSSSSSSSSATTNQKPSIKERLKTMSREYGWTAVGVYLALSALDFPFCFLAVRLIGTETIGHYEHVVVETVKGIVKWPIQGAAKVAVDGAVEEVSEESGVKEVIEQRALRKEGRVLEEEPATNDHGYKAAEKANQGEDASIWTQLALAYAVHKSFIFIRVPLTAAVLPKVVKTLRSWGWNIGKMPHRQAVGAGTGINTKGSKVKPGD
ncbi:uncharacterized protein Z520_12103 [Fonsecaea multimorphosa CBS 102226]|uniref:DUF1279 domain-containing protein n=1 Tax=Fonsecaea multimorphosa CBS 102226 TaxID=1442371 RepID=A0A0D2JGD4_9EURO|nr:uncharacterized protein Z520_12103 [Fonsecaea multimorphosa CBS 102226]KIX92222.1 hypothetical protein Z520_12103 [Fonsecaea multimorphosa CBS 102226]OAL17598.1 hypothetical protein AYO22_11516 [Fonsecaea multimorphosa]